MRYGREMPEPDARRVGRPARLPATPLEGISSVSDRAGTGIQALRGALRRGRRVPPIGDGSSATSAGDPEHPERSGLGRGPWRALRPLRQDDEWAVQSTVCRDQPGGLVEGAQVAHAGLEPSALLRVQVLQAPCGDQIRPGAEAPAGTALDHEPLHGRRPVDDPCRLLAERTRDRVHGCRHDTGWPWTLASRYPEVPAWCPNSGLW
jgi:hypothetical protein